jgi:LDH2 family malate/lactate/ureidoglycolate dehydrogenase
MNSPNSSSAGAHPRRVGVPELHAFCVTALTTAGISREDSQTTADVLVTTDTWGVFTHGVKSLRGYVRRILAGGLRRDAVPTVAVEGPGWAIVDGQSALGMVTSTFAMQTAMAKARQTGIGYAGVHNSCHFGAAGYYAALAAREGLIGLSMSNDIASMTAPGAKGAVIGNNPFAFCVPAGEEDPILLDIAMSTVAGGKVYAARALGKPIPDNWIVDADGRPTTDPSGFPHVGALLPMAGHKGYGLALMIETLSAILSGASIASKVGSWMFDDPARPTDHGAAFFAIHVDSIMPLAMFKQRVDQTIREIRAAPRAQGAERIYLPGEMEWQRRRQALEQGILLPPDVVANVQGLADDLKLDISRLFAPE